MNRVNPVTCVFCGLKEKVKEIKQHGSGVYVAMGKSGKWVGQRCQPCRMRVQRELRRKRKNNYTVKYEKTKKGFLVRVYRNMKSRVSGIQKKKQHLYAGKPLLDKEQFYSWSIANRDFNNLFKAWEVGGYARKNTPSINRINSSFGYSLDNMEWITFSENCALAGVYKPSEHR